MEKRRHDMSICPLIKNFCRLDCQFLDDEKEVCMIREYLELRIALLKKEMN